MLIFLSLVDMSAIHHTTAIKWMTLTVMNYIYVKYKNRTCLYTTDNETNNKILKIYILMFADPHIMYFHDKIFPLF